ncbi:MAG: PD-(D/E)XK nuclease family protein [Spirochaetaceae bacterium]
MVDYAFSAGSRLSIGTIIEKRLTHDRSSVFVFPSEISAAFRRDEAARQGAARAVRSDRFISWDTFKEHTLQEPGGAGPANRTTRMLFAAELLGDNARRPFLRRLVEPQYAGEADAFIPQIQNILPTLETLRRRVVRGRLEPRAARDVEELSRRYRAFLERHDLFEPAWEAHRFAPRGRRYLIFGPELVTDFADFEPALREHEAITLIPAAAVPETGRQGPRVREYETARAEIRDASAELERLLEEGVAASDIAVTICGEDAYRSYFTEACRRREIPVSFRAGAPLTDYPAGRFFENLRALPSSGFSLGAIQALVLDRAVPWNNARALRALVRQGIARGCRRNFLEGGGMRDVWEPALEGEERAVPRRLYRSLRSRATALVEASDFELLRARLYELFNTLLDTERWSETQLPVFQSCLDVLADLIEAERRFALQPPRPYDLWLSALRARVYVPKDSGGGIAVFPYRVAAGTRPAYHFLLNASQSAMQVVHAPYGFLREDEKEALGLEDRDFTSAYAAAYAASGDVIWAAYSRESFRGPQLPPAWFSERGLVLPVSGDEAAPDPYRRERGYFAASAEHPKRTYPHQLEGLSFMTNGGFSPRTPDFSRKTLADDTLLQEVLARRRRREDGRLRISPSDVGGYRHCPFGFLLSGLLGLDETEYLVGARNAADIGTMYHVGLERLYRKIRERDGVFRNHEVGRYHDWVAETARDASEEWARRNTALSPAEVPAHRLKLEESMHNLIDADAERFDGWRIEALECYEHGELSGDAVLGGRMDRIMQPTDSDSAAAVVDYKKGRLPSGKAFRVDPEAPTELSEIQLPLYAEVLRRLGRKVVGLYLYSVEKERYLSVFSDTGNAVLDDEALAASRQAARSAAEEMLDGLRAGDFRFPEPGGGCESCSFPGICRARFVTE